MDTLIRFGGNIKDLGNGKVGGHLVLFGNPGSADLEGDFFTKNTDFGIPWADDGTGGKSAILYNHGIDPVMGKARLSDTPATLKLDDVGVWIEGQLAQRNAYEQAVYGMVKSGKLGWSSGTASHLVERKRVDGANEILAWPLGLDASLTPTPCDTRNCALPLKSWRLESPKLVNGAVKMTTGAAGLPIAPRDTSWSKGDAAKAVREWAGCAGDDDEPNDKYRSAFMVWSGEPDDFTSGKLPFATVIDGKLTAVPKALFSIASVLDGGQNGVDLSDSDRKAVKARVESYYDRMADQFHDDSIKVPWADSGSGSVKGLLDKYPGLRQTLTLGAIDQLQYYIWDQVYDAVYDGAGPGEMADLAAAFDDFSAFAMDVIRALMGVDDSTKAAACRQIKTFLGRQRGHDVKSERDFERFLRDAGFSRSQATAITAGGYKAITSQRDADDGNATLLAALNRAASALKG